MTEQECDRRIAMAFRRFNALFARPGNGWREACDQLADELDPKAVEHNCRLNPCRHCGEHPESKYVGHHCSASRYCSYTLQQWNESNPLTG